MVWSDGIKLKMNPSFFWRFIYKTYPPCLRILERLGMHAKRQNFVQGFLINSVSIDDVKQFLLNTGFEEVILAWKDSQEVLSMRKIDAQIFQYHLRIYADKEVRGHYEFSPEGKPWGHILEKKFEPTYSYFGHLLQAYLKK